MDVCAVRYAEALLSLAEKQGKLGVYEEEITGLSALFSSQKDLSRFMGSPVFSLSQKKQLLRSLFSGKIQAESLNLLLVLLDKGRFSRLSEIADEFQKLSDEKQGVLRIRLKTALPLSEKQQRKIGESFRRRFQAAGVRMTISLDPSLLGGVLIYAGGKLYDGTVLHKLNRLGRSAAFGNSTVR